MSETTPSQCNFCGKNHDQVMKLIVSSTAAICNECISLCTDILSKQSKTKPQEEFDLNPQAIYNYIDKYVISQRYAKEKLAVSVINHYKRCMFDDKNQVEKTNILFWGPTGTGKTLLAKTIADYLGVPFVIIDATTITEAGYVGNDVDIIIDKLYHASEFDVDQTERGIVFIDEVDKIARSSETPSTGKDINGEGVQQALLKMVEGTTIKLSSPKKVFGTDSVEINTGKILFVASGAFVGLDELAKKRRSSAGIGFGSSNLLPTQSRFPADPVDFIKFGMIPEFMGRFPSIVHTEQLTIDDLFEVIKNKNNGILEQYKFYFGASAIELEIDDDGLKAIAEHAIKIKLGARGLRSIFEIITHDYLFNIGKLIEQDAKKLKLTREDVIKYL
jgi:ATP-dependent Clp protease ATP-binding subunit ClpX